MRRWRPGHGDDRREALGRTGNAALLRLARVAWKILLASALLAIVGSIFYALTWDESAVAEPAPVTETCEEPPCFGTNGLPDPRSLPIALPLVGYLFAVLLGIPSLVVGAWNLLRRRRAVGRAWLLFFGPLLVLIGIEVLPHLLSPCAPVQVGLIDSVGVCENTAEGIDVEDRWHSMNHTITGAIPLIALYGIALKRWRPDVLWWPNDRRRA